MIKFLDLRKSNLFNHDILDNNKQDVLDKS